MAINTTAAQLEEVQAAITAVMAGQSWTVDGVSYTRASLADLHAREQVLLRRYAQEQGKRPQVKAVTFTGMGYD